jgi:hypothetical protein
MRGTRSAPITFAHPDFNLQSLRGNAVVRWAFRPGSTVVKLSCWMGL